MKIGWLRGHQTPQNRGADGIRNEDELINEVSDIAVEILKEKGHQIIECTPGKDQWNQIRSSRDSLRMRCETANKNNVDVAVSLHFNFYNGNAHGVEVFYISSRGRAVAAPIQDELVKLGYRDRGVKKSTRLYVLRNTDAPAVLIEAGFCDSPIDMNLYNPKEIAEAIVRGIIKAFE